MAPNTVVPTFATVCLAFPIQLVLKSLLRWIQFPIVPIWLIIYPSNTNKAFLHEAAWECVWPHCSIILSRILCGSSCCGSAVRTGEAPSLGDPQSAHTHTHWHFGVGAQLFLRGFYNKVRFDSLRCALSYSVWHQLCSLLSGFRFCTSSFFVFKFNSAVSWFIHVEMEYEEFPRERLSRFWGKGIYISWQGFELKLLNILEALCLKPPLQRDVRNLPDFYPFMRRRRVRATH